MGGNNSIASRQRGGTPVIGVGSSTICMVCHLLLRHRFETMPAKTSKTRFPRGL
jgi:hypothetical protein